MIGAPTSYPSHLKEWASSKPVVCGKLQDAMQEELEAFNKYKELVSEIATTAGSIAGSAIDDFAQDELGHYRVLNAIAQEIGCLSTVQVNSRPSVL